MTEQTAPAKKSATPDEVIARQRNRQLLVITGVIALLAAAVWVTRMTSSDTPEVETLPLVGGTKEDPAFDREKVAKIEIWKGEGEPLTLQKSGDEWTVPARYGLPADDAAVGSLLTALFDGRRLNRPSTSVNANYVLYQLDMESAAHLRLRDADGAELLHLLVGKEEAGSRAFIRMMGDGAPEGIFEVLAASGQFNSLYSSLKLTPEGQPDPKRWVDFSGFEPLPYVAVARRISIRDGDRRLQFERVPGSDPADDKWEMTKPRKAPALNNLRATDVAGPMTEQAGPLGVGEKREVQVEYTDDEVAHTSTLKFGKQQDGKVAVQLSGAEEGEFVYWCGDFSLSRVFRPTGEYLDKKRVLLVPDGVQPQRLSIVSEGSATTVQREEGNWRLVEPFEGAASNNLVNGVVTALSSLSGYVVDAQSVNRDELKIGPGLSTRWIEARYSPGVPSDQDGDGAQDAPEPETPGEDAPAPEPATPPEDTPAEPAMKSARLYFGTTVDNEIPVLRVVEGEPEQVFWLPEAQVLELFPAPRDLQDAVVIGAVKYDQSPTGLVVKDSEKQLTLTRSEGEWVIGEEPPVKADNDSVDGLIRRLRGLTGIQHEDATQAEALGAWPEAATRSIRVTVEGGGAQIYFGNAQQGYVPVLTRRDGSDDALHWVKQADVDALFVDPADYRALGEFQVKVRQVLVSWKGKNARVTPKDPARTREQAQQLVEEIIQRARGGEDFVELQRQYNEDSAVENVYDVSKTSNDVRPFKRLASELDVGEVGYCETDFGFHILKRIE